MRKPPYTLESIGYRLSDRKCLDEGMFGAHAPYWCVYCGPSWTETEWICSYRGCGFEGFSGPEEDEYEGYCPHCGRVETHGDNQGDPGPFRMVRRYSRIVFNITEPNY